MTRGRFIGQFNVMSTAVTIISLYCRRRKNGLRFILLLVREQIFISIFYYVVKPDGAVVFLSEILVHSCPGNRKFHGAGLQAMLNCTDIVDAPTPLHSVLEELLVKRFVKGTYFCHQVVMRA